MRWYIIKALLVKEWQRHLANRGGIALALLLIAAAVLLSVFAPTEAAAGTGAVGGVHHCFIDFDRATPLIKHLEANRPPDLKEQIRFRQLGDAEKVNGLIVYPTGTGALQVHQRAGDKAATGRDTLTVFVWHPDGEPTALAPYEAWFWRESRRFYAARVRA